ncbi:MAG: glycerol-3-phosphate dehydrogenase/oxidase [Gemmatimonadetes bacterium]|nr:glycerol-3-phosphate dehydrogenase/oxidase [Gemmatimonadota bacterium]
MSADPVDLLVMGAGINGTGIARDAAMRGIRTALVDKGDFGSGTSGQSSRLIHGGLRYLEMRHFHLVFEASRERRTLLRIAPHLVWPRSFIFPIHDGGRIPLWKLWAGLTLYDLLALFRNVRRHRMLSKQRVLKAEPHLRSRGLKGGGRYFDAQCDDARLTLANAKSAHQHGALVANYVVVDAFEPADGRIRRVRVTDRVTGASYTIRAKVVVNATGPWSDILRAKDGNAEPVLRLTKGVHVAVPMTRLGNNEALALTSPIDGRVMFIIPWGELSYIGTTDTDDDVDPNLARATADDVIYLLRSANAFFPEARLSPDDVVSTWAGIRPMVAQADGIDPSAVSREHRILESQSGVISLVGGKLTTYRAMAEEVVDLVAAKLHKIDGRAHHGRAPTDTEPLPGGDTHDLGVILQEVIREGFSRSTGTHLVRAYGTETAAVLNLAASNPTLAEPIVAGHPAIKAELVHAIRREMAITLTDLLMRRLHIFYEVIGHAVPELGFVVDLAGEELGWDAGRKASELAAYLQVIQDAMAFRDDLRAG